MTDNNKKTSDGRPVLVPRRPEAAAANERAWRAERPKLSPFCEHLDSKKLMLASQTPKVAEDVLDASQHCWCGVTMKILGPDGNQCHPDDCRKGRSCFTSSIQDLL